MRAKTVNEAISLNRSQEPKVAMGLGMRHKMELPNGYEMEGPYANKDEAERLVRKLDDDVTQVQMECEDQEIYDDAQMDACDEVVEEYEPKLKELGYDYTEEWK